MGTSRRVNALEYVLIPRIEVVLAYITREMDEQAREEFFRVKKVVEKKKVKLAREAAEEAAEALAAGKKYHRVTKWTFPACSNPRKTRILCSRFYVIVQLIGCGYMPSTSDFLSKVGTEQFCL